MYPVFLGTSHDVHISIAIGPVFQSSRNQKDKSGLLWQYIDNLSSCDHNMRERQWKIVLAIQARVFHLGPIGIFFCFHLRCGTEIFVAWLHKKVKRPSVHMTVSNPRLVVFFLATCKIFLFPFSSFFHTSYIPGPPYIDHGSLLIIKGVLYSRIMEST